MSAVAKAPFSRRRAERRLRSGSGCSTCRRSPGVRRSACAVRVRRPFRGVRGSFLFEPLPHGADVITLVAVVHDHDDAAVRILLKAAREALPPGGRLVLAEPMSGTPGAGPITDAYFGLYLLAMGSGALPHGRRTDGAARRSWVCGNKRTRHPAPAPDAPSRVHAIRQQYA